MSQFNITIFCFFFTKYLKTTGNIFLASLALADLLVASFVNMFNIIGTYVPMTWYIGT